LEKYDEKLQEQNGYVVWVGVAVAWIVSVAGRWDCMAQIAVRRELQTGYTRGRKTKGGRWLLDFRAVSRCLGARHSMEEHRADAPLRLGARMLRSE
jgi:hypothetical protein